MVNAKKLSQLSSLEELLQNSPHFALFEYEKTPHTTLEGLRKELRKNDSKFKMVKNTIFQKALRRLSVKDKKLTQVEKSLKSLRGNTALLTLGSDWSSGLSTFYNFTDKGKGLMFKFGYLDQEFYIKEDLEKIAKLPGKAQLMAQLIGSMKSPISHVAYAMKFNMQKLAYILNVKSQQA